MQDNNDTPWQYKPDGKSSDVEEPAAADNADTSERVPKQTTFAWRGTEFIEHPHNTLWYGALAFAAAALTVFVYFVTKDYIATATIPIVGIIVGIFAKHKPRVVDYEISDTGLKVGEKDYPYSLFKSFSVLQEGNLKSVNLFPLKRFMPPIAAYFDPANEDKIINALGDHLPYEERQMDQVDRLSRRLRL